MSSGKTNNLEGDIYLNGTQLTATATQLSNAIAGTAAGKKINGGQYTMVAGDDTQGFATIATGLTTVAAIAVDMVDGSNNVIITSPVLSFSGANITVADGLVYAVTAGHKVNWIAFGT